MDYRQAVDYILGFADFERTSSEPVRYREFNLERVQSLLRLLGDPHLVPGAVHIAGTKGKGSITAMVASVLGAAGYRVGRYTSPHLHTIRERVAIGHTSISEKEFAREANRLRPLAAQVNTVGAHGQLTTFELLTALAFRYFQQEGAQYAVLEVGLGGRLDATNVVTPLVCGIANISHDHTEVLGETLTQIAGEKAGIIKAGVPIVCAPQTPEALDVIASVAREKGSPLCLVGRDYTWRREGGDLDGQHLRVSTPRGEYRLWIPLLGEHQLENTATAVAICEELVQQGVPVPQEAVRQGLAQVSWPGRMEILGHDPLTVVDGAHNPHSMRRLIEAVKGYLPFKRVVVLFGANRTKNLGGMVDELAGLPLTVIATQSRHPKAASVELLVQEMERSGVRGEEAPDVAMALARARELAGPQDLILATGSLFIVAEVREAVLGIAPELYSAPLRV